MKYINSGDFIYKEFPTVVTVGNFDGLHKGHRALIDKLKEIKTATGGKSLICSFSPRPIEVLRNIKPGYILTPAERAEAAAILGVDILVEYPFSLEISRMSGEEFIKTILTEQFNCKYMVVGTGFAFGKNREWNVEKISELCSKLGIGFTALPHKLTGEEKISSTAIREYLKNGEITKANELLGYDYYMTGTIGSIGENGAIRIEVDEWKILPKNGMYISEIRLENGAVCSSRTSAVERAAKGQPGFVETYVNGAEGLPLGQKVKVVIKG